MVPMPLSSPRWDDCARIIHLRTTLAVLPVAILALAACSQEAEQPTAPPAEPAEKVVLPDHDAPPAADEQATEAKQAEAIPQPFIGVWDFVDGSCNPASDLRMDISPGEIEFYESHGAVTSVKIENAQSIVVSLDMTGEGENWQITNRFVLSEGDTILTPLEMESDSEFQPLPRKRCKS